jgi:hypothetical protein
VAIQQQAPQGLAQLGFVESLAQPPLPRQLALELRSDRQPSPLAPPQQPLLALL